MPPRARLPDLSRLFDSVVDPLYVVDDRRRIVYLNEACAALLGVDRAALAGRECRYRSDEAADPLAAAADALCPPPLVELGRRITAELVLPVAAEGAPSVRTALFLPWNVGGEKPAVLVWLLAPEAAEQEQAERRSADAEARKLHALAAKLRRESSGRYALARLVGESPALKRIRNQIVVAAGTSAALVVVGRPGSGRGHIARAVHFARPSSPASAEQTASDSSRPLVPLDAAVLGPELLQSTIRGMIRTAREAGRAEAGTLLLLDVDRLPADAQAELAGFLKLVELPLRIISTSTLPLERLAETGGFRPDLAAWLSTLTIEVPPLATRPEDVASLAQAALEELNSATARQLAGFTTEALDRLAAYNWPGEARELFELVHQVCRTAEGPLVQAADLPKVLAVAADAARHAPPPEETIVLDAFLADVERDLIGRAMAQAKGNKTVAARLLGLTRPRLYRRLVQLGLETETIVFEELIEGDDAAQSS